MAKQIIQMYDKYHSTKKVYPKIIKECLEEDVTNYIEGVVVANPTLAGTESELTGLQVGNTKYKVPEGTVVTANPELAGTEADLSSIEIDGTKYKVGGGNQIYQHFISVQVYDTNTSSAKMQFAFKYSSSSNEEINTYDKLMTLLISILGSNTIRDITNGAIDVNGFYEDASKQATYLVTGNYASAWTNDTLWLVHTSSGAIGYANFPDPAITRWVYTIKDIVKTL